jgi:hypothetical protein
MLMLMCVMGRLLIKLPAYDTCDLRFVYILILCLVSRSRYGMVNPKSVITRWIDCEVDSNKYCWFG